MNHLAHQLQCCMRLPHELQQMIQDNCQRRWSSLQENKESILVLATSIGIFGAEQYDSSEELRSCALHVLEAVERNGVLPPWTLVPPLMALITDPSR